MQSHFHSLSHTMGMKDHWQQHVIPGALGVGLFAIYLSTICPTVYVGDSGELTAAAFCLGIPHNSGYPLYALLGKLFCLIPLGNIGFRVNLMSTVFAVLTVLLVYSFILKIASSHVAAFVGALVFAFTPVFWSQTVSAEVYTLHTFFVALLARLLYWWEEKRSFCRLALFVFVTGISFGNHFQTVMLAPAVLFMILSGNYKALVNFRNFFLVSLLFVLALCLYLYLPIRTEAGAALHWGDPNTLSRFLAHVTARAHRGSYVLTKGPLEYFSRTREALWFLGNQFGVALVFALLGWIKLASVRWRIFLVAVIVFDFVYTVFLNMISLEITPFGLPSCLVLATLVGIGTAHILRMIKDQSAIGKAARKCVSFAFCAIPAIPLTLNYNFCNQSSNYTAYEHAVNIFRTVENRGTLFLDGDNNVFPVTYGRVVEKMREDVTLYDRYNVFFKMPYPAKHKNESSGNWEELRPAIENRIIEQAPGPAYYAVFNPASVSVPDQYTMFPFGILYKVVRRNTPFPHLAVHPIWSSYVSESIYDQHQKDFMNRQVCAYFHFAFGKHLFISGQPGHGLRNLELASRLGYDDTIIHSDIAVFLTDQGLFKEAKLELEKAMTYHEDLSAIYNNWGYYYHKRGDDGKAIESYRKAIELKPENYGYYNNLGLALYDAQRNDDALVAFRKSLAINGNQPQLQKFLREGGLNQSPDN